MCVCVCVCVCRLICTDRMKPVCVIIIAIIEKVPCKFLLTLGDIQINTHTHTHTHTHTQFFSLVISFLFIKFPLVL